MKKFISKMLILIIPFATSANCISQAKWNTAKYRAFEYI